MYHKKISLLRQFNISFFSEQFKNYFRYYFIGVIFR